MSNETITIDELTDDEWKEIRKLAFDFHSSGVHNKDYTKCCISAFLEWLGHKELGVAFEDQTDKVVH